VIVLLLGERLLRRVSGLPTDFSEHARILIEQYRLMTPWTHRRTKASPRS
jgi:hypothetical protein